MTAYADYSKEQATIKGKVTRHKINIPKSIVFIIQFVNVIFGKRNLRTKQFYLQYHQT